MKHLGPWLLGCVAVVAVTVLVLTRHQAVIGTAVAALVCAFLFFVLVSML
jgi:hypothetical protein